MENRGSQAHFLAIVRKVAFLLWVMACMAIVAVFVLCAWCLRKPGRDCLDRASAVGLGHRQDAAA